MTAANGTTDALVQPGYVQVRAQVSYCVRVPAGVSENEAVRIARRAVHRVIWLREEDWDQGVLSTRGIHPVFLSQEEVGIIFAVLDKDDGGPTTWPDPVDLSRIAALYGQPFVPADEQELNWRNDTTAQ